MAEAAKGVGSRQCTRKVQTAPVADSCSCSLGRSALVTVMEMAKESDGLSNYYLPKPVEKGLSMVDEGSSLPVSTPMMPSSAIF